MSLSILQSIHPKYCELIAAWLKPKEARKTKPRIPTPFKTYIYQSKHKWIYRILEKLGLYQGKVIGEYVCDEIQEVTMGNHGRYDISDDDLKQTCLSHDELWKYGKGKTIYLWHISNLKIYDKPKELSEFSVIDKEFLKECPYRERVYNNPDYTNGALLKGSYICNNSFEPDFCRGQCADATKPLTRAPQSWCYVEKL